MFPRPCRALSLLLLLAVVLGTGPVRAGEGDEGGEDGGPIDPGPGPDLGDQDVPFAEQVNRAIEEGTRWLRARPEVFLIPGGGGKQGAWWGPIKGPRLYGGGRGPGYPHPAGTTALALYTLLKCGVSPEDPAIRMGFAWLRSFHRITPYYDGPNPRGSLFWSHTVASSSYELSMMILALTAKYDPYKKSGQTEVVRRNGKLKIKNREDRAWLLQLAHTLVDRRGRPGGSPIEIDRATMKRMSEFDGKRFTKDDLLPPVEGGAGGEEGRRGWRYNLPHLRVKQSLTSFDRLVQPPPHANQDLSSTQLAALALYAAHQFSVKVDLDVWFDIVDFTLAHQEKEGPPHERHDPGLKSGGYAAPKDFARGFMYLKGSPDPGEGIATGSMTGCGITNLLLAKQVINDTPKGRKLWSQRALDRKVETAIWDGLAWLDRNWSPFRNPRGGRYHTYYLYSIERAQDLRRKQLIGTHLWYREGAEALLGKQRRETRRDPFDKLDVEGVFWNTNSTLDPKDVLDTCFTLLFLKRATRNLSPAPVTPGE